MLLIEFEQVINNPDKILLKYSEFMSDEWYYIETDIQTLHNFGIIKLNFPNV